MANVPTVFPVWLVASDGVTPVQVNDLPSYNAAVAMGAAPFSPSTQVSTIASGGGSITTVSQIPLDPSQVLPPADSVDIGVDC